MKKMIALSAIFAVMLISLSSCGVTRPGNNTSSAPESKNTKASEKPVTSEEPVTGFSANYVGFQVGDEYEDITLHIIPVFEALPEGSTAWLGIMPDDTPDDEKSAEESRIAYRKLSSLKSQESFDLPIRIEFHTFYELRIYSGENGGELLFKDSVGDFTPGV